MESLSILIGNLPTEEQAEREATSRLKKLLRDKHVTFIGLDSIGWSEPKPTQPCPHCQSGKSLKRYSLCLACTRATTGLQRLIDIVMKDQAMKIAFIRKIQAMKIVERARMQRLTGSGSRKRGAQPGRGLIEQVSAMLGR